MMTCCHSLPDIFVSGVTKASSSLKVASSTAGKTVMLVPTWCTFCLVCLGFCSLLHGPVPHAPEVQLVHCCRYKHSILPQCGEQCFLPALLSINFEYSGSITQKKTNCFLHLLSLCFYDLHRRFEEVAPQGYQIAQRLRTMDFFSPL